jgi:hypothetical protein
MFIHRISAQRRTSFNLVSVCKAWRHQHPCSPFLTAPPLRFQKQVLQNFAPPPSPLQICTSRRFKSPAARIYMKFD